MIPVFPSLERFHPYSTDCILIYKIEVMAEFLMPMVCASGLILSDISTKHATDEGGSLSLCMQNLSTLRVLPFTKSNCNCGNTEELHQNIALAITRQHTTAVDILLFDMAPPDLGRNVNGLDQVAKRLNAQMAYSTIGRAENMRQELLVGQPIRASAMSYMIYPFLCTDKSLQTAHSHQLLECAKCYKSLENDGMICPIFVSLGIDAVYHHQVVELLTSAGVSPSSIVFSMIKIDTSPSRLSYCSNLLLSGCRILFDCLGHNGCFALHDSDFPSDSETLLGIHSLLQSNGLFIDQIMLSNGMRGVKTQFLAYGGAGHLCDVALVRKRLSSLRNEEVGALLAGNLVKILSWYKAPSPVELPEETTIPCFMCEKKFCLSSDHYSKFGNEYCSSACLARHRKEGWKK